MNNAMPPAAAFHQIPVQYHDPSQTPPDTPDQSLPDNLRIAVAPPDPDYNLPPRPSPNQVPDYVVRHLPRLMAAANDPDAPPTMIALYRAIVNQLSAEQGA